MDPDDAEEISARILAAMAHLSQEEQEKNYRMVRQ